MTRRAGAPDRRRGERTAGRDRIVRAGLALLDRDGYEGFSLRRLAEAVGTTPMALYHYFANKGALLDAVLGAALAELRVPRRSSGGWVEDVRRLTLAFRRVLARHPHVVPVLMSRPALGPGALRWYDTALALLRRSGLDDESVVRGYAALYCYTLGFASIERVRAKTAPDRRGRAGAIDEHLAGLPPESVATLVALAPRVGRFDQAHFEFGLDLLLDGLATRARQP
jgi:AcrR family transcriptional regulator